jgi:hypothetical protein
MTTIEAHARITVYRADGTIRDAACSDDASSMQKFYDHYNAQGFAIQVESAVEVECECAWDNAHRAYLRECGVPEWGPGPLCGPGWDDAWRNGPGAIA